MSVTVVIGGQYGSEGKGKVAFTYARDNDCKIAVRVGGSNSGHTVIGDDGNAVIFRHLPTAALLPDTTCILAAGTYIDVNILLDEISQAKLAPNRVMIDPNAVVVSDNEISEEKSVGLRKRIGSTGSGTGAAVIGRIKRDSSVVLAKDEPRLAPYIANTRAFMREQLNKGTRILVEGTQGFGLSLLHSKDYPFTTSRDTSAAAFVSEAGLSPLDVDEVIMVIRAFPIRVPGNSGPLPNETDWKNVSAIAGQESLVEYTSVTKSVRRVAHFDPEVVVSAIAANNPTHIVMNHLDYIDAECSKGGIISQKARKFLHCVEQSINRQITHIGFDRKSIHENVRLQNIKIA
jgi:adenylosuccinate synthase